MRDFTSLGQAIVDPTRVRIIAALRREKLCVCELVDALGGISQSTLSSHLQVLRQTGMVITKKEGRWIYYSLTDRKAALIETIFSHIQPDSDADPHLRRDSERIAQRLAIRENGRCVLGFTAQTHNAVTSRKVTGRGHGQRELGRGVMSCRKSTLRTPGVAKKPPHTTK